MKHIIRMLAAAVYGLAVAIDQRSRGLVAAANTYDEAVETHENGVRRTNDAAVTTRHLLWKKGAGNLTVALAGAGEFPLGTIDNVESGTGVGLTVLLLGKGSTKKMVASAAIGAGVQVVTAANGKVRALPAGAGTYTCVGVSLTAAAADNDIVEVNDCAPFQIVVAA